MGFMDIIPSTAPKLLTSKTGFSNYLLIVYSYSKIPKFYVMERTNTEEVTDKLDMFQSRFGKIDEFVWWDLEIISEDAGTQFTSTEFQDECQSCGVHLTLVDPEDQEMNRKVEVTWRTLRTVAHSLMVNVRVSEAYIHFALMYTSDHIFLVLPIKYLMNEDGEPTTPFKLVTGKKPSVSFLRVLCCPCLVRKDNAHGGAKALNMRHQVQKGFLIIFVLIPQHQKWCLL